MELISRVEPLKVLPAAGLELEAQQEVYADRNKFLGLVLRSSYQESRRAAHF